MLNFWLCLAFVVAAGVAVLFVTYLYDLWDEWMYP